MQSRTQRDVGCFDRAVAQLRAYIGCLEDEALAHRFLRHAPARASIPAVRGVTREVIMRVPLLALFLGIAIAGSVAAEPIDALKPMAFLAGSCWKGTFPDGQVTDEHCFQWLYGGKALRDTHTVRAPGRPDYIGETTYYYDSAAKRVEYLYVENLGDISRGTMESSPPALVFPAAQFVEGGKAMTLPHALDPCRRRHVRGIRRGREQGRVDADVQADDEEGLSGAMTDTRTVACPRCGAAVPGRTRRGGGRSAPSAARRSTSARGRRRPIAFRWSSGRPTTPARRARAGAEEPLTARATRRGAARRRARRDRSPRRGPAARVRRARRPARARPGDRRAKPSQPERRRLRMRRRGGDRTEHREVDAERRPRARARRACGTTPRRRACRADATSRRERRRGPVHAVASRGARLVAMPFSSTRAPCDARARRASRANAIAALERPRLVAQLHEPQAAPRARARRGRETRPRRCPRRT